MHHKKENNKHSSSNFNNPQHQKNNGKYPTGPAPGGSSTPAPQKASYLSRLREKFKKPEEKPATKEEVAQLRLNAQREQARFMHKNYVKKSKELKGSSGWSRLFSDSSSPSRGRRSTGSSDLGFFTTPNNNDMFGSGEGAMSMFGAGPKTKGVRGKQPDEWGGLKDMF